MARPLRIEYAGALYHITSRGNAREDIYRTDEDRKSFIQVFSGVCEKYNWACHAYCLMDNHYHLLVETVDGNLSTGMRQLNGVYTQKFNQSHKRVGHVFQGRYKAILVERQTYLLELSRYIVLNPVRARMVPEAKDWPWSSYRATAGFAECEEFLTIEWLLASFSPRLKNAHKKYTQFVTEGKGQPPPWEKLKNQVYLGSEEFVAKHISKIDANRELSEIPKTQRRQLPKTLAEYAGEASCRDQAICLAYKSDGYTLKDIGEFFELHYSRVSRIVRAKGKT